MSIDLSLEQNFPVGAEYALTLLIFSCLVHCSLKRMLSSLLLLLVFEKVLLFMSQSLMRTSFLQMT